MSERPRALLPRAALAQALAAAVVAATAFALRGTELALEVASLPWLIGLVAAPLALMLRLPWWWALLEFGFAPALAGALAIGLAPGWYLLAFVLSVLLLGNSVRDRVPLYLSSRAVWRAVAELLPARGRFLDLGCGGGGGVAALSRLRPEAHCDGVESSPLLWLWSRLRLAGRNNAAVALADLWSIELKEYDLVYAFLSPAPMAAVWTKARAEMRPGSRLVSNSFPVPDAAPARVIEVADRRRSRLYVYEL